MLDKDNKFDESVNFVARHYRQGALSVTDGWRSLGLGVTAWWRRRRVAIAASIAAVVFAASAGLYEWYAHTTSSHKPTPVETTAVPAAMQTKRLEFVDVPLADVVAEIERVYEVRITGVPEGDNRLTLSYEGNAADLVATINELLGINLIIES